MKVHIVRTDPTLALQPSYGSADPVRGGLSELMRCVGLERIPENLHHSLKSRFAPRPHPDLAIRLLLKYVLNSEKKRMKASSGLEKLGISFTVAGWISVLLLVFFAFRAMRGQTGWHDSLRMAVTAAVFWTGQRCLMRGCNAIYELRPRMVKWDEEHIKDVMMSDVPEQVQEAFGQLNAFSICDEDEGEDLRLYIRYPHCRRNALSIFYVETWKRGLRLESYPFAYCVR